MTVTPGVRPDIPFQVITPADVKASIARARRSLERAAEEIVWQIEMEAWRTLGYSSWGAMREAEYGGAAFMVPSKSRPELVARIRAKGESQREIAATAGVGVGTVNRDLNGTGVPNGTPPADDVIDAEIVEGEDISEEEFGALTVHLSEGEFEAALARARADDDISRRNVAAHATTQTSEAPDAPDATTDSTPVKSAVTTTTCPTCHGTGKVTR